MRLFRRLFSRAKPDQPFRSDAYWTRRYAEGGNSGPGSYGRLADYKADVINALVEAEKIGSVIEFGSGDGNQCSLLDASNYVGVDISERVIHACRARFADKKDWRFLTVAEHRMEPIRAELSMSLDVLYHLVEDPVFDGYMTDLFDAALRFVLIYSSDHEAATNAEHVRHRAYSDWVRTNAPGFGLVRTWEHPFPLRQGADHRNTTFAHFKLFKRIES